MFFDAKEFHSSNKEVANILGTGWQKETTQKQGVSVNALDQAKWGEDDIEIDDDNMMAEVNAETDNHEPSS